MTTELLSDEQIRKARKQEIAKIEAGRQQPSGINGEVPTPTGLEHLGNRAIQRLLAQRGGDGPSELDDNTEQRINRERGGGQSLDRSVQAKMGDATGHDFGSVRVHTSLESDALNHELGAKAFTTGQDVFFRDGAYDPHTSDGQELLAHELTHVVQQSSGAVGGGGRMTVNAPGDAFEQEADAVARTVMSAVDGPSTAAQASVQRQGEDEEEEVQMQPEDGGEIQRQPEEDEDEAVQMQADEEEEEEAP